MEIEFSQQIFETTQTSNFTKIISVAAELFHTDGQTDMTKLTVAFRNFVNEPDNKPVGNTHSHTRLLRLQCMQQNLVHSAEHSDVFIHPQQYHTPHI